MASSGLAELVTQAVSKLLREEKLDFGARKPLELSFSDNVVCVRVGRTFAHYLRLSEVKLTSSLPVSSLICPPGVA